MRDVRPSAFALACIVWSAAAAPLAGQAVDDLVGQRILSVRVTADGRDLLSDELRPLIDTRAGEPLDVADVRRTLRALVALDRFEDISVEATPAAGGLDLAYVVRSIRRIEAVDFRGDRGLSSRRLRRMLAERFGDRIGHSRRAREMAGVLAQGLRDAGYLAAQVSPRVEPRADPDVATLVFDVSAGPRYRVGDVTVTGPPLDGEARLRQRLGLQPGSPWTEPAVRARAEREAERWRERGHYQARIDVVPRPRPGEPVVDVDVNAPPGPLVELVFEGDALPKARLADLVPVQREGSVDEDLLEDSKRRLERYLRGEGHRSASVNYRRSSRDGRLRVAFEISRGQLFEVEQILIAGARSLSAAEVQDLMTLRVGQPFVEAQLGVDVATVTRAYQDRGFGAVTVAPEVTESGTGASGVGRVRVRLAIDEGPRTLVGAVRLEGNDALTEGALRAAMSLRPGDPFHAQAQATDRAAVELAYLNAGFADAIVDASVTPSADGTVADLTYRITEGQRSLVQHVIVTGNERTSTETIVRELRLRPGQPIGLQDLTDAQRRLAALGLFRRVRIDALGEPGSAARDVVVAVEENAATSIGYGAGIEGGRQLRREGDTGNAVERLEFAPRGFFEIGRRNLWGKNRSVNLFARASLRRDPGDVNDQDSGGFGLYEYRGIGAYREPRAFGWAADASIAGVVEQAIRASFSYRRRSVNADLSRRVGRDVTLVARYSYGFTDVYEERYAPSDKPLIDRLFPQVRLSTVSGVFALDTRDDPFEPTRGHLVGNETDVALRSLGSEVGFVKSFSQGFLYRQIPGSRLVVAGGVRLGLAKGFARLVERQDEDGNPVLDSEGEPIVDTIEDLPASERYYAGGDTTVRGFTQDRLGDEDTIDKDGFPTGGDAVLILNGELRFPVTRTLGGVVFMDAGNVFTRVSALDLARIRATAGVGVRYKSPIGPLRVDVGFKLDPKTLGTGERERRYAVHISIGQAF